MKQICRWSLLLLTLWLLLDLCPSRAEEGFFKPDQIVTPFDKNRVLRSIVRIHTHLYWDAVVFASEADASTFRQSFRNFPGSGRKTYLQEGVVLWHVVLTKNDLDKIRADIGQSETPGLFEIVRAFDGVSTFPTEKIVPLQGYGTGFLFPRMANSSPTTRSCAKKSKPTIGQSERPPRYCAVSPHSKCLCRITRKLLTGGH